MAPDRKARPAREGSPTDAGAPGDPAAEAGYVIACELRAPLTAIRSFSEILRDNPDIPRDQRVRFLDTILAESDRLDRAISAMVEPAGARAGLAKARMRQ